MYESANFSNAWSERRITVQLEVQRTASVQGFVVLRCHHRTVTLSKSSRQQRGSKRGPKSVCVIMQIEHMREHMRADE